MTAHPQFAASLKDGLGDAIVDVADKGEHSLFEIPHTPSWERAEDKLPHILDILRAAGKAAEKRLE